MVARVAMPRVLGELEGAPDQAREEHRLVNAVSDHPTSNEQRATTKERTW